MTIKCKDKKELIKKLLDCQEIILLSDETKEVIMQAYRDEYDYKIALFNLENKPNKDTE